MLTGLEAPLLRVAPARGPLRTSRITVGRKGPLATSHVEARFHDAGAVPDGTGCSRAARSRWVRRRRARRAASDRHRENHQHASPGNLFHTRKHTPRARALTVLPDTKGAVPPAACRGRGLAAHVDAGSRRAGSDRECAPCRRYWKPRQVRIQTASRTIVARSGGEPAARSSSFESARRTSASLNPNAQSARAAGHHTRAGAAETSSPPSSSRRGHARMRARRRDRCARDI